MRDGEEERQKREKEKRDLEVTELALDITSQYRHGGGRAHRLHAEKLVPGRPPGPQSHVVWKHKRRESPGSTRKLLQQASECSLSLSLSLSLSFFFFPLEISAFHFYFFVFHFSCSKEVKISTTQYTKALVRPCHTHTHTMRNGYKVTYTNFCFLYIRL